MKKIRGTMKPLTAAKAYIGAVSEEERLFLLLAGLCGLTAQRAYQIAFNPKASPISCCAMASKVLSDPRLQQAAWRLANLHEAGKLAFNDRILKTTP